MKIFYQPKGLHQYSVLNSMYRSGLVDTLVTHANTNGVWPNSLVRRPPWHTSRSYYIDLLLIKMPDLAMFQEIWSQFKVPSTNRQQFSKHGTGHFSNQFSKNQPNYTKLGSHHSSFQTKEACCFQPKIKQNHGFES